MGWAGDAIGAVGTLGGSVINSRAQNRATEAQERANREALAFSREQEQAAQGRYGESKAQYDQQVADWYAARNALLGRYGVDISLGSGGLQGTRPPAIPGAVSASVMPRASSTPRPPAGSSTATTRTPATGATLGDLAQPTSWNDWSRYGL